tara:strand:+ start:199 stop:390 length:192 start_codon:yes stop_codon:yes gene_type:complete
MKEYEIEVKSFSYYKIEANDLREATNKANELFNSGDLFDIKEIDRGSEISSVFSLNDGEECVY